MDSIFFSISDFLRSFPNIIISIISIFVCNLAVVFSKRYIGYAGLCCYMALSAILGNIQVLYATSYEIINMPVLLGTVSLSSSFLATDFANEFYGAAKARKAVLFSFFVQVFFILNILITFGHKPLNFQIFPDFSIPSETVNKNIDSIGQIFMQTPRIMIASYIAYLCSQLSETWLYRGIRCISNDYIRHNISLFLTSVIIDTSVFTVVGLVLLSDTPLSFRDFINIFVSACLIRTFCNLINSVFLKREKQRQ